MTYPASPEDAAAGRLRLDAAQFWAGAGATAVVAALIALVGILISRWTLNIPILAPSGDGAWGNAHSGEYVFVAAVIALVAAGLLYLLVLGAPRPTLFFGWIMGLATLAAVVYPFSTSAPLAQKGATAIVNLVLGIAVISLLLAVFARAVRRPLIRRPASGYVSNPAYESPGYTSRAPQYRPGDQAYQPGDRGYPPGGPAYRPAGEAYPASPGYRPGDPADPAYPRDQASPPPGQEYPPPGQAYPQPGQGNRP